MFWLLLGSLAVGLLGNREFRFLRKEPQRSRYGVSAWFLLFICWFPTLCWIFNRLWPQY